MAGLRRSVAPLRGVPRTDAAILAACAVVFAVLAFEVQRNWVNVPVNDQWDMVPDIRLARDGDLRINDLWAQHNEHRLVFPRIVLLSLALVTEWDVRVEMIASLLFALGCFAVVYALLRRSFTGRHPAVLALAAVSAAALMFSPVQYENWLWGWQVQWFMNVLGALTALAVLELWPARRRAGAAVAVAIVAAFIGQYSLANGVFIWVVALPILAVEARYRRWLPVWILAGGVSTLAYLVGYHKPEHHPPTSEFFRHPLDSSRYVALYLGRPLSESQDTAIALGYILTAIFLALCVNFAVRGLGSVRRVLVWFGVGMYAVFSAITTAIGRAGFGVEQAGASRYTTVALLLTLAVMAMAACALADATSGLRARPAAIGALLATPWLLVGAVQVLNHPDNLDRMESTKANGLAGLRCLERATSADEKCLTGLYFPGGRYIYDDVEYLRRIGWFATPAGKLGAGQDAPPTAGLPAPRPSPTG